MIRWVLAPNPSPLTLDGTRTYLIGRGRVAVVDPGPLSPDHLEAVAEAVGGGRLSAVLVTHAHADHAAGADALAARFGVPVRAAACGNLRDGDRIDTDAGELRALATPGHTPDHFSFHLPAADAVFCGDLLLGGLSTALVAAPEGDLGDYLTSLERVRRLEARVLYPAHGLAFSDPAGAIAAYVRHRRVREAQVLGALSTGAERPAEILEQVYGAALEPGLRAAAAGALDAYLAYLARTGRVRHQGEVWRLVDPLVGTENGSLFSG